MHFPFPNHMSKTVLSCLVLCDILGVLGVFLLQLFGSSSVMPEVPLRHSPSRHAVDDVSAVSLDHPPFPLPAEKDLGRIDDLHLTNTEKKGSDLQL